MGHCPVAVPFCCRPRQSHWAKCIMERQRRLYRRFVCCNYISRTISMATVSILEKSCANSWNSHLHLVQLAATDDPQSLRYAEAPAHPICGRRRCLHTGNSAQTNEDGKRRGAVIMTMGNSGKAVTSLRAACTHTGRNATSYTTPAQA